MESVLELEQENKDLKDELSRLREEFDAKEKKLTALNKVNEINEQLSKEVEDNKKNTRKLTQSCWQK